MRKLFLAVARPLFVVGFHLDGIELPFSVPEIIRSRGKVT